MIIPIPKYTGHVNSPRFGTTLWFTVGSLEVFIRFDTDFYCNDCTYAAGTAPYNVLKKVAVRKYKEIKQNENL